MNNLRRILCIAVLGGCVETTVTHNRPDATAPDAPNPPRPDVPLTPSLVRFAEQSGLNVGVRAQSNAVELTGFTGAIEARVEGEGLPAIVKNGAVAGTSVTVQAGDRIAVAMTVPDRASGRATARITLGADTTDFAVVASEAGVGNRRYRIMHTADPARTITIAWDSLGRAATERKVHYDVVDRGTEASAYAHVKIADVTHDYLGMKNAIARITGLEPDTIYHFIVADDAGRSRRFHFRTMPATPDRRLSIVAGGDSRNNRTPRQRANRLVQKLRPDVVFFGGDYTDLGWSGQWQEWMDDWQLTIGADGRMTPIVGTRGNHEDDNTILTKLFDLPASNSYALSYGGSLLRLYTLNTEASIGGAQTTWLKEDLASAAAKSALYRLAQYHRPMRPHVANKSEGNSQYDAWAATFFEKKVRLVIESDAHTLKNTWPIRPTSTGVEGFVRDDDAGTVYVGEGGWGAPLRDDDDVKVWTRDSDRFNHFHWLWVDKTKLEVRTVKVDSEPSAVELPESDRFAIPAGLEIWNPRNGDVLVIPPGTLNATQ